MMRGRPLLLGLVLASFAAVLGVWACARDDSAEPSFRDGGVFADGTLGAADGSSDAPGGIDAWADSDWQVGDSGVDAPKGDAAIVDAAIIESGALDGSVAWSHDVSLVTQKINELVSVGRVARDSNDNIAISGGASHNAVESGGLDLGGGQKFESSYVASFDQNGAYRWDRFFDRGTGGTIALAFDAANNLYVAMSVRGTVDLGGGPRVGLLSGSLAIVSYTSNGAYRWDLLVHPSTAATVIQPNTIAVGAGESVVVGGRYQGTTDFGGGARTAAGTAVDNPFLLALGPGGAYQWDAVASALGPSSILALVVDGAGRTTAVGGYSGAVNFGAGAHPTPDGGAGGFAVAYSSTGARAWEVFRASGGRSVRVDGAGNVVALFGGPNPQSLSQLDPVGNLVSQATGPFAEFRSGPGASTFGVGGEVWCGVSGGLDSDTLRLRRTAADGASTTVVSLPFRKVLGFTPAFVTSGLATLSTGDVVVGGSYSTSVGSIGYFARVRRPVF